MSEHRFVEDVARSITCGPSLAAEKGLGTLTLPDFLLEVTERFAPREALVQHLGKDGVVRWSYATLRARSMEMAKALIGCGLGRGERVGILMTNRAEFLSAVFGTALAGGVAVPLSTFSTPRELEHLVSSAACSVLLFERQVLKKDFARMLRDMEPALGSARPGALASSRFPFLQHLASVDSEEDEGAIEGWAHFLARGGAIADSHVQARAASVSPADPAVLFFSSGSTNLPKGILSAHRGVAIQLWRIGPQQVLDDGVRSWTANGFFWSGNFAMVIGGTLARGGSLILQRIFQAEEALSLMQAEKASFLFAWPHQWAQLVAAENWNSVDLSSLRFIDAECPIARHPTVATAWVEPRHCYGNTETFTLSTAYPAGTSRAASGGSFGLPLPGNTLKIVDPLTGAVLPVGERGEIAVKGPTLMLGYLGLPLNETLDEDGYFRTGDGGYLDGEGRLFWQGRLNDIIKTGGANVSPVEIDEVLRTCPGVKVSQTVGVPHETLGELVIACIVAAKDAVLNEAMLHDYARERLASFKMPRRFLFFAETDLELTGSAKVKTAELRQLAEERLLHEADI